MKLTDKIEVLNCDCMELMAKYPDKYFDLAVVDPPYGDDCDINSNGNRCATRNGFSELYLNHTSKKWNKKPDQTYFSELKRVSKNQIIWGGNFFNLETTSCWLMWNKMQRNFTFGDGELAWTSFDTAIRIFDMSRGEMQKEKRFHITQKPIKLYDWIFKNYAEQGFKILDTHGGSMSSVISADKAGLEMVCCELDKEYFDKAVDRFQKYKSQYKLAI